jgi:glutamate--cysteine ligase catalytic subunit
MNHAAYLHDSFVSLGPIFGALAASAPIYKGQLANWDFRWKILCDSQDPRTDEQMDPNSEKYIPKSRYSTMNHFISDHPYFAGDKINDGIKLKVNRDFYKQLTEAGMNDRLAYHFASLFVHEALVIFDGHTEYTSDSTEHFENFNSTNWTSVRFKPPPSLDSDIGWRVEFRTLDIQLTDFENAAYVVLLNLVTKVINDFDVNFSLPISLSDVNMERAQAIDAVTNQKFWFRRHIVDKTKDYTLNEAKANNWDFSSLTEVNPENPSSPNSEFVEMSILDLLEGNQEIGNTGLVELFHEYMKINKFSDEDKKFYNTMISFLVKRARGEIKTGARYMRDFVLNHPEYQFDSVVNNKICYDLVKETTLLGIPEKWDTTLCGEMPGFMKKYFE